MTQRRSSSQNMLKLAVVLSLVGAALFLLSDTLFGESDLAYFLMFVGPIAFTLGLFFVVVSIFEMLVAKVKSWIKNR